MYTNYAIMKTYLQNCENELIDSKNNFFIWNFIVSFSSF